MKIFKYILVAMAATMASCTDDAVDALTGKYQAPVDITVNKAADMGVEKLTKTKRIFTVDFSNETGDVLSLKLVGDNYYVHAANYTPAPEATAKKGNYIIGAGGSTFKRAGGSDVALEKGGVMIEKDGDNYTVNGTVWLADGSVVRVKGSGVIVYEADPVAIPLTKCLSYANNNASGTKSITLVLATEDVDAMPNAWGGMDYIGAGNYLSVDFYSEDGSLPEGTYTPADASAMTAMTYGKGWDPGDLWGIGIMFENWATCWWTVDDGVATAQHIEDGNITVAKKGSKYVITYDFDGLYFEFEGQIEALDGSNAPSYDLALTKCLSAADNNASGTKSITLVLATDGVDATPNAWGGVDYSGSGNYLAVDLYSEDGKLHAGTYTPADANAMKPMTYGKGWDPGDLWGIGISFENWATCWWTVDNGAATAVHITEGDIIVDYNDGIFTISYANGDISAQYKGAIAGIEGVAAAGGGATVDYTELTSCLSAASNVANGTKSVTLVLATDGVSATANAWGGVDYSGSGNYLAVDLYSEDGSIASGTYTAADANAMTPMTFGKGWDPGDLWGIGISFENWATCWWTVDNGQTSAVHIEDGTIKVEGSGSNYTITIESPVVNARFQGEIKF